jgi:hypothetical protein
MTKDDDKYFYLTPEDNEVLLKGNLNKTDWIVYVRLRLFENSEEKPDVQEMNQKSSAPRGGVWKTFCSQTLGFHCKLIFSAPRGGELHPNYY